ncbi:MAG TPA: dihydropteroate synthase [Niabella sp.]|nr:dihydropteroate synthase [Niabella sp.]HOZ97526.1 dihydropteroate synthase [Niabella sp.]HQW15614.1 dihydropteroate synthase [Niabella sp.]HQX20757.1 dihydropteroate synthase [Niabella sp.]HQX41356.1 dihydropteroate synthase [Niabella sp.]
MFTLNCKGRILTIDQPIVMGILNINNDSFYTGSRFTNEEQLLIMAEKMLTEGATILDIGGQSTRPGSERINPEVELSRVLPAIEQIKKNFPEAFISIDTYHSLVARKAVEAGACIINDISAGMMDEQLLDTVARLNVPYILMHMKGTPQTMQQQVYYENVSLEILDYFIKRMELLRSKGIKDIILDPGFGFGKTIEHNFSLLKNLSKFQILQCPILLGLSRKATVYKTLGVDAEEALNGTTVLNTIGLLNGASILRVHDTNEAKQAIQLVSKYTSS